MFLPTYNITKWLIFRKNIVLPLQDWLVPPVSASHIEKPTNKLISK